MIFVNCGRCGSLVGMAKDSYEAKEMNREHIAECEIMS